MNTNKDLTVKVKYLADIDSLQQIDVGDCIDVRCAEETFIQMFQYAQIPLGFACKIPDGYMAILMPRSSFFKKYGCLQTNSIGIIDNSYCGDGDQWAMPVVCLRADITIPKNERIGQFMIVPKMGDVKFKEVETLGYKDRGGFGSTGRM